ncbi:MAG: hypothetical protein OXR73_23490 [Myxococcales bacterium]|nr:hypothetical protein [Myxococcales bacterium]
MRRAKFPAAKRNGHMLGGAAMLQCGLRAGGGRADRKPIQTAMANTLVCTVELSKTDGITLTVKNESGKITQTVHMDGTKVTTQVKGQKLTSTITQKDESVVTTVKGKETSTITQKEDAITVKVKNFTVDAETVTVKSKKDSTHEAKGKFTAKSTKDMTLQSSAKLTVKSTQAMTLSSSNKLTAKATQDFAAQGMNAKVEGKTKATVKGGTQAEVAAAQVAVKGSAKVDVEGAMTNVGKSMTTIKGQMVKVDSALIKLG